MDVNERLRKMLDERGLTTYKMAELSGLSHTTLANVFKRNTVPSGVSIGFLIIFGFHLVLDMKIGANAANGDKQYNHTNQKFFAHRAVSFLLGYRRFTGLGGHQTVEFGICGEFVCKRNKRAADLNQAVSSFGVRDIGKL